MTLFNTDESMPQGHCVALSELLAQIPFDQQGLIPAIAQQYDSGVVLMLAWMNRQALEQTLTTGQVCYWSRSRKRLWQKGESSGHVQQLMAAALDCDGDALLLQVNQTGPACHTQRPSCFYWQIQGDQVCINQAQVHVCAQQE